MRSRILIILLFFALTYTAQMQAQTSIGIIGGLNLQSVKGDAPADVSYGSKPGFMIGINAERKIANGIKLVLQPNYTLSQTKLSFDIGEEELKDSMNVKMVFIRLPVLAKIEAFNGVTYFLSGLDFGFLQEAKIQDVNKTSEERSIKDSFESFDLAAQFGVGVKFPIKGLLLSLEGRYSQSLLNLSKKSFDSLPSRFRLSGFQFLTNLSYNL